MAFSTHDIVPDSPTNNFCTLNVLLPTTVTVSNGNLSGVVGNAATKIFSTFLLPNIGQWYWEVVYSTFTADGSVGIAEVDCDLSSHVGNDTNSFAFRSGNKATNSVNTPYGSTYGAGDVLRVLWDGDNRQILFGLNVTMYGVAFTVSTDKDYYPAFGDNGAGSSSTFLVNFGQDPSFGGSKNTPATVNGVTGPFAPSGSAAGAAGLFYYPPPAGAKALCTANLPEMTPDVTGDVPQDYFKAVIWTGNGSHINVGFDPDLIWYKARNTDSYAGVVDSIRGDDSYLQSFSTDSAGTASGLLVTDSTGFTPSSAFGSNNYVAWCWKAGGASVTNNDGSITSTVSSNTDAGFSIVKYTGNSTAGASVGHGLDQKPDCIIVKRLTGTNMNWGVYHQALASNEILQLDVPNAVYADSGVFNGTQPTSSVFYLGGTTAIDNTSGEDYIAYCWHSVEGYSKFGSYTGNGSTDGPMVYCGFRPAFVMIKQITTTSDYSSWAIFDNARDPSNPTNYLHSIFANRSAQEGKRGDGTSANSANIVVLDILSNGFKLRDVGGTEINQATKEYIFMAFAEQPFKFSNAR